MPAPDGGQTAMEELERQWYNAVVTGLGLDMSTFQLVRPTVPLGATSDSLWAYFNNIPPLSLTNNFANSGANRFYDDYRGVVGRLIAPGLTEFENNLGDAASEWKAYINKFMPIPDLKEWPKIFTSWAMANGHEGIAMQGASELESINNNAILRAQTAVQNEKEFIAGVPNFSGTIAALRAAIPRAEEHAVTLDTSNASSKTENAWAKGSVSGMIDFFNGGGSASFAVMSAQAASAQLKAKARFQHAMTFRADPGSWYSSAALSVAYAKSDNYTWKVGTPDWNSTFGEKGSMQRIATSLVVVDGIEMTIESAASFSSAQQQEIEAHASVGFWPFFSAHASGGAGKDVQFTSDGKMTVKSGLPAGNPVVFGANVMSAAAYIGSQSPTRG